MTRRTCDEIRDLLPFCADGALSEGDEARVREHLEVCEECRLEAEGWSALGRVLARGLVGEEPASAATVEEALRRVHEVRPAWRVAPAPVRFWRAWTPAGALALTAAAMVLVGLHSPWVDLHQARAAVQAEAAAVVSETVGIGAIVPSDVSALPETVRSWPQDVRHEVTERWDDGAVLAQSVLSRTGPVPLVAGALLLFVVNVVLAKGAIGPRRRLQEGA